MAPTGNASERDIDLSVDLGTYRREAVSNVDGGTGEGRTFFDLGLRLMLSYQHEMASQCFLQSLRHSPDCALAHSLVALCHCPDYNFKGDAYYESTNHPDEADKEDPLCIFPSQQLAARHSQLAVAKVEEIRKLHRDNNKAEKKKKGKKSANESKEEATTDSAPVLPDMITDVESQLVSAIRVLTCNPGVNADLANELVGRPYADTMRSIYQKYPNDAEVAYFFVEALMVLNAWQLYEYPTGRPLSDDVVETRSILETALQTHRNHAGLCHMYVHLSEMSADPGKALDYCQPLRKE